MTDPIRSRDMPSSKHVTDTDIYTDQHTNPHITVITSGVQVSDSDGMRWRRQ